MTKRRHNRAATRQPDEESILDHRAFFLDDAAHDEFLALLDRPAKPSEALRARLKRRPCWERQGELAPRFW